MFEQEEICAYEPYGLLGSYGHAVSILFLLNCFSFFLLRQCLSAKPEAQKPKLSVPPQYLSIDVEQPAMDDFPPSRGDSPYGEYRRGIRRN